MKKFLYTLLSLSIVILSGCSKKDKELDFLKVTSGLTYTVEAAGGMVNVNVETNTDYFVSIPDDAKNWISVIGSRATMQDVFTLSISPNNTAYRTAKISLKNKSGEVLANIQISQDVLNTDWIDSEFAKVLENRGYIKNASTVTIKEVEQLTKIDVSGTDYSGTIKSMKGLEYFVNLEELNCNSNILTELNVSSLKKLKVLDCSINYSLTSINISQNTALTHFICEWCPITSIDISHNIVLTHLDLRGTSQITKLDVSKNIALTYLVCTDNQVSSLDVSSCSKLNHLWCANCKLTKLDISKNTLLTTLWCDNNLLTTLDVSKNPLLNSLNCTGNQLEVLNLSFNPNIGALECQMESLKTLYLKKGHQIDGITFNREFNRINPNTEIIYND